MARIDYEAFRQNVEAHIRHTINPEFHRFAEAFLDALPDLAKDAEQRGTNRSLHESFNEAVRDVVWLEPNEEELEAIKSSEDQRLAILYAFVQNAIDDEDARTEMELTDAMVRYLHDPLRYASKVDALLNLGGE
ncbi:hypothetical protein [Ferrovibrio sp.]|uniref:hypothetical protein n=1 Tax=Ferrovibrio sp. TaxID=1917215 RepID=UPI0035B49E13